MAARVALQSRRRDFAYEADNITGREAIIEEHAAHLLKMKRIRESKSTLKIPAPVDRRWQPADEQLATAPPRAQIAPNKEHLRQKKRLGDLEVWHMHRRVGAATAAVDASPSLAYRLSDTLCQNRSHRKKYALHEHDYNVAHMLHRISTIGSAKVARDDTPQAHALNPVHIYRRTKPTPRTRPASAPRTQCSSSGDGASRRATESQPHSAETLSAVERFEQMLVALIVEKQLYHDHVRMDDLMTVAIRQNPHIERRLLEEAATRVFNVCYIPPAPFKPTLMLTPHGMSDKYSNTGMPAQPQPQPQHQHQAYSPTNPREFDFVNKPGSFALLEELTDSALSLSNRTPSSVGDTGRTAESTSKDALAGASALSL